MLLPLTGMRCCVGVCRGRGAGGKEGEGRGGKGRHVPARLLEAGGLKSSGVVTIHCKGVLDGTLVLLLRGWDIVADYVDRYGGWWMEERVCCGAGLWWRCKIKINFCSVSALQVLQRLDTHLAILGWAFFSQSGAG